MQALGLALSLVVLVLQLSTVLPWSWWSIVHITPVAYLAAVLFAGTQLPGLRASERPLGLWALITMHLSWGTGFLYGILGGAGRTVDKSRM
mgnify:CR=1 FL=1